MCETDCFCSLRGGGTPPQPQKSCGSSGKPSKKAFCGLLCGRSRRKQRKAFEEGVLRPAVRKKQEEAAESLRRRRSVRKGFHLKYQENLNKG